MTTVEQSEYAVGTAVAERRRRRRPKRGEDWWRHAVAIVTLVFALFPVVYIVSAAFNADPTLVSAQLIPEHVTLDNFRQILSTEQADPDAPKANYVRWYANSIIIPGTAAIFSVFFGALAAYAFSRFRFRGRRMGMLALLLIQMFPQFLALVAIYVILLNVGEIFPSLGLNTMTGLMLVYLGGALGVNTWLMKGFFDTIPSELDESARVDGATPNQVFWGVILPLAVPVLAVVALISFIFTLNEFVIASAVLQTSDNYTLVVGLQGFISEQYAKQWGPFTAGVLLAAIPPALLFLALQRFIVEGLTRGAVKG
ncbi:MAG TPA: sugar ABC transporter permease [Gaiellaceae bacterium]|nr:sugar ABC transporter permease [Gaiellaceae bacterium]